MRDHLGVDKSGFYRIALTTCDSPFQVLVTPNKPMWFDSGAVTLPSDPRRHKKLFWICKSVPELQEEELLIARVYDVGDLIAKCQSPAVAVYESSCKHCACLKFPDIRLDSGGVHSSGSTYM